MQSLTAMWDRSLAALKNEMTQLSYDAWIVPLEPICVMGNVLVIQTTNDVAFNTLTSLYSSIIIETINRANNTDYTLQLILPSEREKYLPKEDDISLNGNLNPKYTFETFVVGGSNNLAHAAAKSVAANPMSSFNPLFIYGGVGLGKTHLIHAIGNSIRANNPKLKLMYITSETFTNELIDSISRTGGEGSGTFRNKYRKVDVLMVDDIQFIAGKATTQEEFFNTFNSLYTVGKLIILTSDKPPMEMPTLENRLRSRFEGGLIVDIQPPDIETRTAILKRKASAEGITIEDEVLTFIAERISSNVRQLEGCMTRVIFYSRLYNRDIDIEIADRALKDIVPGYKNKVITIELIQQVVADYFSIEVSGLLSPRRTMEITYPRQIAMYMCKQLVPDASLKTIGKHFGGRDHTTVISACSKITKDLKSNESTAIAIEDITKRLKQ